jgi:hypothetical protein
MFLRRSWVLSLVFGSLVFGSLASDAQRLQILNAHPPASLRGLCAPAPGILWTSGSSGTVGRSTDGGVHWTWIPIPGFEKRDFRDIEAFDSNTALIMGIDTPGVILRTSDGGAHWNTVFRDETPGMFLDAMDMAFDHTGGVVVGDPVETPSGKRFYLCTTVDGGKTWRPIIEAERPMADSGEGCFASSGSNIAFTADRDLGYFAFVSGGPNSRLFRSRPGAWDSLPLRKGATTTGANSIGINGTNWIVVGGDFQHDTLATGNCAYSLDHGRHWQVPHTPPHGYRSCVKHITGLTWLCCGTSGVDVTYDGGDHWKRISTESFHVAAYPGSGKSVYLAGARGRIAELIL